jgi:hypothetical protein
LRPCFTMLHSSSLLVRCQCSCTAWTLEQRPYVWCTAGTSCRVIRFALFIGSLLMKVALFVTHNQILVIYHKYQPQINYLTFAYYFFSQMLSQLKAYIHQCGSKSSCSIALVWSMTIPAGEITKKCSGWVRSIVSFFLNFPVYDWYVEGLNPLILPKVTW